jgi:hypothetical protein
MDIKNQENIHYRAASKATHSGVEVLKGEREIPRIIIERIEYVENININGRTEKCAFVAHFQPGNGFAELPMIINQTNARRITKLYPDCQGYLARLHNIAVRLTSEPCKDPNGGGTTVGLRISQIPAASEQEMAKWMAEHGYASAKPDKKKVVPESKVGSVVAWAKKNGHDFDKVADMYDFESDTVRDAIADALNTVEDMPE